jgi:hypothetical protein
MQVALFEYRVFLTLEGRKCLWLSKFQEVMQPETKSETKSQKEKASEAAKEHEPEVQSPLAEVSDDLDEQRKKLILWLSKRK